MGSFRQSISPGLQHHLFRPPPVDTDHKAITLSINFNKFKSVKGYPKVKNSLYQDPSFISKINDMISETLSSQPDTRAENLLDLVLFNTSTIATQHLKEAKDTHHPSTYL